jgi:hypothetical protein
LTLMPRRHFIIAAIEYYAIDAIDAIDSHWH